MKNILVVLLISSTLLGCSSIDKKPEIVVQTITKNIYIEIPDEFLMPCIATKPPSEQAYLALDAFGKEYELFKYSTSLLVDIAQCNLKIDKLKQWNAKQRDVFIINPIKDNDEERSPVPK